MDLCKCAFAGLLWGVSNPFVKNGQEATAVPDELYTPPFLLELRQPWRRLAFALYSWVQTSVMPYLCNPHFLVPFVVNQLGSMLFLATLAVVPLSRAAPVCGGVNFVATATVEAKVFQRRPRMQELLGTAVIMCGAVLALSG